MLYKEAVDESALGLLKLLQSKQYLRGFYLAGGTALAFLNGYRRSDDIDLFSNFSFDTQQMLGNLVQDFDFDLMFSAANTLRGSVNNIKVDIIAHRYRLLEDPFEGENIRILSEPDIIAMTLYAISTSRQKIKDFVDIYYLLEKYELGAMLNYYWSKYDQENDMLLLKSLIYFDDVDVSEWPVLIKEPHLKWRDVRRRIEKEVISFSKNPK